MTDEKINTEQNEELHNQSEDQSTQEEKHEQTADNKEPSVEELQQQLAAKTNEAEDCYNRLLRTQADFDNFRRRSRQEREELLKFASEGLITELLPVLDNFDRAFAAADKTGKDFVSGVQMIYRQLKEVLAKEGLEEIAAEGEEFDPNKHEAIMQVEADADENIVVEEMRKGYTLKGKVIRPAMVKVAK